MGAAIAKTLVFQPPSPVVPCDQIVNSSVDSSHVWLETRRGSRIEAFFVDRRAQMTVLFSHANAEDVSMVFAWLRELSLRLGVNVLGYSYTGYARSSKPPSELDVYADVDAAWDYLMDRKVDARRVVLYSRSVGSGPTLYLAERLSAAGTPPAGVVLQSPILSVFRIAFDFRYTLPGDLFPNVDRVGGARCPVLVIHGTHDEVVPFSNGQDLHTASAKVRAKLRCHTAPRAARRSPRMPDSRSGRPVLRRSCQQGSRKATMSLILEEMAPWTDQHGLLENPMRPRSAAV